MSFFRTDGRQAGEDSGQAPQPVQAPHDPAAGPSSAFPRPAPQSASGDASTSPPSPAVPPKVARLEKVELERLWGSDAAPILEWLGSNVAPLGEAIGLSLRPRLHARLATADSCVIADEEGSGPVVVVVELGNSSDERFGILLRQLAANSTTTAVWVSGSPRPEHIASVSWLNRSVGGRFYLARLQAVRIEDSPVAPIFTSVLRPARAIDTTLLTEGGETPGSGPASEPGRRAEDWHGSVKLIGENET